MPKSRSASRPLDLSLYLVLDPDLCGGEAGMIRTALEAAAGGATIIQLRTPTWKKRREAECARALLLALRPLGTPLVIDDDADVALAVGADGLHIGQDDLAPEDARRLLGPDAVIGLSVGSEVEAAASPRDLVDYVGIGPVYTTQTKKDAGAALGLGELARLVQLAGLPSVAIGGVKASNAADVMTSGVDGIAVVSAICGQAEPRAAAAALSQIARRARKP